MSKKTIKINELKQADILLFSASDDKVSQLIAKITESPVTHSALSYYDYSKIVEEVPPYAQINEIKERIVNREITVMRLNPWNNDMSKVLDIASNYVNSKVPYSKINLAFVGMYILLKKSLINSKLQKLVSLLLKHITSELIKIVDEVVYKNPQPMVCSQFVYNCYENAGNEYKLIIKNESVNKSLLKYIQEHIDRNNSNLEPKLFTDINKLFKNEVNSDSSILSSNNIEALLKEILSELESDKNKTSPTDNMSLDEELVVAAHEFCSVIQHVYGGTKNTSLVVKNRNKLESKPINEIIDIEQYFVTPGDLLTNCTNLSIIGTLDNNSVEQMLI